MVDATIRQHVRPDVMRFLIPRVFKRDGTKFEGLPEWWEDMVEECHGVGIRLEHVLVADVGPGTKLLGNHEAPDSIRTDDYFITFDDDIAYPPSAIQTLMRASYDDLYGVYAASGFRWNGTSNTIDSCHTKPSFTRVDVVEGFGGILYRGWMLRELEPLATAILNGTIPRYVWTSDDVMFSNALSALGVPRSVVRDGSYNPQWIMFNGLLAHGLREDALHNGAGDQDSGGSDTANRYAKAARWLMKNRELNNSEVQAWDWLKDEGGNRDSEQEEPGARHLILWHIRSRSGVHESMEERLDPPHISPLFTAILVTLAVMAAVLLGVVGFMGIRLRRCKVGMTLADSQRLLSSSTRPMSGRNPST